MTSSKFFSKIKTIIWGNMLAKVFILFIKFYQKISKHTVKKCRYYPCCSCYAIKALKRFGAFKGSLLTFKRILKCNSFFEGGIDDI